MDDSFFSYLQRLELLAFFSGYPLLYAIVVFIAGKERSETAIKGRIVSMLPYGYALVGTLYLGLQIRNLYPDYSFENIKLTIQDPFLISWGLLSIFFWIPVVSKKPVVSLLHSLVFFFFLIKDLFIHSTDKSVIRNNMNIYTTSLLINIAAFAFLVLLSFLFNALKKLNN